uniref:Uncharacterized protein n=1 Tax=Cacopsylla melanoneura TaxID=428564 RepID=A0A8D8ZCA8_9HEMI
MCPHASCSKTIPAKLNKTHFNRISIFTLYCALSRRNTDIISFTYAINIVLYLLRMLFGFPYPYNFASQYRISLCFPTPWPKSFNRKGKRAQTCSHTKIMIQGPNRN